MLNTGNANLSNEKSLLKFFNDPKFDIHSEINYLYKTIIQKQKGPHDFLVNKLYSFQPHEIDFYLPEICYLLLSYKTSLQKFVTDMSGKDLSFFMKVLWIIESFGVYHNHRPKGFKKHLNSVTEELENTAINAGLQKKKTTSVMSIQNLTGFEDAVLKEIRNAMKDTVKQFIISLVNNCFKLKHEKIENRKQMTKSLMIRTNNWLWLRKLLNNEYENWKDSNILTANTIHKQGVIFAFPKESEYDSNLIVRILHDESTCFNTKKRVPYRVVFETIDPKDLGQAGADYSKDPEYEFIIDRWHINRESGVQSPDEIKKMLDELLPYDEEYFKKEIVQDTSEQSIKIKNMETYLQMKKQEEEAKELNEKKGFDYINETIKKKIKEKLWSEKKQEVSNVQNFSNLAMRESVKPRLSRLSNIAGLKNLAHTKRASSIDYYKINKDNAGRQLTKQINLRYYSVRPSNYRYTLKELNGHYEFFKENFLKAHRRLEFPMERLKSIREYHTYLMEKIKSKKSKNNNKYDIREYLHDLKSKKPELATSIEKFGGVGPWEVLWEDKIKNLMRRSPYSHFPSYKCRPCIIKGGDDLRQEVIAMQIIQRFSQIFTESNTGIYLKPYEIMALSSNSGMLEFVPDSISVDGLKKKYPGLSLRKIYEDLFGQLFVEAQKNFTESLAGYSLLCYLLQIKDRHNGNILIVAQGRIIHIDFGFILSISPGSVNFETAPFKLTKDYVELMDGENSTVFQYFKVLIMKGLSVLQKHADEFSTLLEIMMKNSDLPCFQKFSVPQFKERFACNMNDIELGEYVERLVQNSLNNKFTNWYDDFQKLTNGIDPQQ